MKDRWAELLDEFERMRPDERVAGKAGILTEVEAAEMEFVPTSRHQFWGGKYRCLHCTVTGYLWRGCEEYWLWWGLRHGRNCRKRP